MIPIGRAHAGACVFPVVPGRRIRSDPGTHSDMTRALNPDASGAGAGDGWGLSARIHTVGTLEGATRAARPLPPAIPAIQRAPEVEDLNSPAEVEKGVLGSKLRRRDLAPPKAALILFARSLLLGRSLCERLHPASHVSSYLHRIDHLLSRSRET